MTALVPDEFPFDDVSASSADAATFGHLGLAVMLCWNELPIGAREQILNQTDDMIGVTPIEGIRDDIVGLLLRHGKA